MFKFISWSALRGMVMIRCLRNILGERGRYIIYYCNTKKNW